MPAETAMYWLNASLLKIAVASALHDPAAAHRHAPSAHDNAMYSPSF
jgi:hypothetical protein